MLSLGTFSWVAGSVMPQTTTRWIITRRAFQLGGLMLIASDLRKRLSPPLKTDAMHRIDRYQAKTSKLDAKPVDTFGGCSKTEQASSNTFDSQGAHGFFHLQDFF